MSLKENIEMVKDELNQEEKFFESAVKTERFVKKYKMPLLSVIIAFAVIVISNALYQSYAAEKISRSNEAYLTLLSTPDDAQASQILKENNQALYDAWQLQTALKNQDEKVLEGLKKSSSALVADLAAYELATIKKEKAALNAYALNQDAVMKELALLNEAVLLMQEGKNDEAKARLALIDERSSLHKMVTLLRHYGVK